MRNLYVLIIALLLLPARTVFSQVDYSSEIQPIFNANCVACHGGTSGVTLSSYSAVMNSVGQQYQRHIVTPHDPDDSPLVDKLGPNPQFGSRMPLGGSLPQSQINLIRQWIQEGAHETPQVSVGNSNVPREFTLAGNYPNPFNPSTNIAFSMPEPSNWVITVYNVNGSRLMQVAGFGQAGPNTVPINMQDFPSGLYIYTVEAKVSGVTHGRLTGKMLLVK